MAKINGNELAVSYGTSQADDQAGYELFAHSTNASIQIGDALIDTTDKGSDSWAESISGRKSWSITVDGFVDYATLTPDDHNIIALADVAIGTDSIFIAYGVLGDAVSATNPYYVGEARLNDLTWTGETDGAATYSATLTGVGVLSKDVTP